MKGDTTAKVKIYVVDVTGGDGVFAEYKERGKETIRANIVPVPSRGGPQRWQPRGAHDHSGLTGETALAAALRWAANVVEAREAGKG